MAKGKPGDRENTQRKRDASGRWLPGVSGNPSGGPKGLAAWRRKCREFMDDEGWEHLYELATTKNRDQRAALELISAYAYGKPTQPIAGDDDMAPIHIATRIAGLSDDELAHLAGMDLPKK